MMDPDFDRDFNARTNRDEVARLTAERDNAHRTIRLLLKLHEAHHNHPMHAAARALLAGQGE